MSAEKGDGLVRNALVAVLVIACGIGALGFSRRFYAPAATLPSASVPEAPRASASARRIPAREPLDLSAEQRTKGYWECSMPDPGFGFYRPMKPLGMAFLHVPKSGGHTEDFGYDVLLHFHGFPAVRKTVVTTARGLAFAGVDLGNGSSAYSEPFFQPQAFTRLKDTITEGLRAESGDPRAHIRHLALSAWSAGYGAVSAILRGSGDEGIDAVILLDGLHSDYAPGAPHDDDPASIEGSRLSSILAFAQRATRGEKIFYFSHSRIETVDYASTTKLAGWLLSRLSLSSTAAPPTDDPLGLLSYVDVKDFHVRDFGGKDERAHCDHTRIIAEPIREYLEPAWQTPPAE